MDSNTRHFRAGVGAVIYTKDGRLAWFERATNPVGTWQFQQGGIDLDEKPEVTLWRELKEETGLEKADIVSVTEYPHWTVHPYPEDYTTREDGSLWKRIGQVHRWFFLEVAEDTEINLDNASTNEFSDWKWTTFADAVAEASDHKRPVYEELKTFFEKEVRT